MTNLSIAYGVGALLEAFDNWYCHYENTLDLLLLFYLGIYTYTLSILRVVSYHPTCSFLVLLEALFVTCNGK